MADPNRALFESVVHLLAPLLDELVFVGGCMTGLFITDPAAGGPPDQGRRRDCRRNLLRRLHGAGGATSGTGPP